MLKDYPQIRKIVYIVSYIVGGVLGATQIVYGVIGSQPVWLTAALAVYVFFGTYTGVQAAANTTAYPNLSNNKGGDGDE